MDRNRHDGGRAERTDVRRDNHAHAGRPLRQARGNGGRGDISRLARVGLRDGIDRVRRRRLRDPVNEQCCRRNSTNFTACACSNACRTRSSCATYNDAVELIGKTFENRATLIVIPVECLDDEFFRLKTRIAGELIQKFVQYRRRLVIVGDISRHLAESSALARLCERVESRQRSLVPREPRGTRRATRAGGLTQAARGVRCRIMARRKTASAAHPESARHRTRSAGAQTVARAGRGRGNPRSLHLGRRLANFARGADSDSARAAARGEAGQRGLRDGEPARARRGRERAQRGRLGSQRQPAARDFRRSRNRYALDSDRSRPPHYRQRSNARLVCRRPIARPSNCCASTRKIRVRSSSRANAS